MPNFPAAAPTRTSLSYTATFVAAGGDVSSVSIDSGNNNADAEFFNWASAVGNVSNAAMSSLTLSEKVEIPLTFVSPFDESYSSASTKLIMVWGNQSFEQVTFAIPAPDEAVFGNDGVTVDNAYSGIIALNIATLQFLTATIGGTWGFLRGFRSERTRKLPRPRSVRNSVEPPVGELPARAPGTEI